MSITEAEHKDVAGQTKKPATIKIRLKGIERTKMEYRVPGVFTNGMKVEFKRGEPKGDGTFEPGPTVELPRMPWAEDLLRQEIFEEVS